jgi:hypothetical protein
MTRKILASVSLSGLLLGAPVVLNAQQTQEPQDKQQQTPQATKSINGKILNIGDQGRSFTMDTGTDDKQLLKFIVDRNTKVQGQVKIGTLVAVDYQATDNGELVCGRVTAQG